MDVYEWYKKIGFSYFCCVSIFKFKRTAQAAFTLIECMIYLVVFVIMAHIIVSFLVAIYHKESLTNYTINTVLQLYSASDKLVHDIHHALIDTITIDDKGSIAFRISLTEHVRWYIKNSTLMRASQRYNLERKRWSKRAISVASQHVHTMSVQLINKGNEVQAVMIMLRSPHIRREYHIYVSLYSTRL